MPRNNEKHRLYQIVIQTTFKNSWSAKAQWWHDKNLLITMTIYIAENLFEKYFYQWRKYLRVKYKEPFKPPPPPSKPPSAKHPPAETEMPKTPENTRQYSYNT